VHAGNTRAATSSGNGGLVEPRADERAGPAAVRLSTLGEVSAAGPAQQPAPPNRGHRIRIPVTRRPWFGPKRGPGYGWSARSWQGWLVLALFVAATIGFSNVFPDHFWIPLVILLACLSLVIYLTRDTSHRADGDQP
jgi:hypothetical protein